MNLNYKPNYYLLLIIYKLLGFWIQFFKAEIPAPLVLAWSQSQKGSHITGLECVIMTKNSKSYFRPLYEINSID